MPSRRGGLATALLLTLLVLVRPAAAADASLRIVRAVTLGALPLLVMEREHLIERTAEAMGLGQVSVAWSSPGEADPLAALTAGNADLAMVGLVPLLVAADAGAGTPSQVRAVGAVAQRPYVLVTRNKAISTLLDFTANDRIAVPTLKNSGPAVMLEMAAAQQWGPEHYDKLDRLAVALPDAAAAVALSSGKGGVDAHFSRSPYADGELADAAVHRVMDSFDIAGPHSVALLAATMRLRAAHPELCKAILSALQAADDFIRQTPGAAAEIFAAADKEQSIPIEDLSDMIGDPDLAYGAAPAGVMRIAQFMHRIGRLKHRPQAWQDFFLPESRDLPGS